VLLRNALTMKSVESYRQIYSWKGINCLELWARVLSACSPSTHVDALVYPVTQLLLGSARLVPSARWFPVRLRLVRVLIALSGATGVFVPVAPLLLEVLSWPDFAKPAHGTGPCPDLLLQLKLSKSNLKQPSVQQELVEQVWSLVFSVLLLLSAAMTLVVRIMQYCFFVCVELGSCPAALSLEVLKSCQSVTCRCPRNTACTR
jgi:nucleolar complex protein 2